MVSFYVLLTLVALSASLNIFLIVKIRQRVKRPMTIEATEVFGGLIHSNPTVWRLERIKEGEIFVRSPKDWDI